MIRKQKVRFFKQVQSKMHWAVYRHIVAEIIYQRTDANKDNMRLTSCCGERLSAQAGVRGRELQELDVIYPEMQKQIKFADIVTKYCDLMI